MIFVFQINANNRLLFWGNLQFENDQLFRLDDLNVCRCDRFVFCDIFFVSTTAKNQTFFDNLKIDFRFSCFDLVSNIWAHHGVRRHISNFTRRKFCLFSFKCRCLVQIARLPRRMQIKIEEHPATQETDRFLMCRHLNGRIMQFWWKLRNSCFQALENWKLKTSIIQTERHVHELRKSSHTLFYL